jgi:F0F1-type ATP synthase assembly protein I
MPRDNGPSWLRLSGIGVEVAAAVAGFTLVGYWVDRHFASAPWGLLIGLVLGLVGGLYNLVRESLVAAKSAGKADDRHDGAK